MHVEAPVSRDVAILLEALEQALEREQKRAGSAAADARSRGADTDEQLERRNRNLAKLNRMRKTMYLRAITLQCQHLEELLRLLASRSAAVAADATPQERALAREHLVI